MRAAQIWRFVIFLAMGATTASGFGAAPPCTTESLIDELAVTDEDSHPFGPITGQDGFLLVVGEKRQTRAMSRGTETALAAMRELARRGTRAIPHLLAHLDDDRPTSLIVRPAGYLTIPLFLDTHPDRNLRTQRLAASESESEILLAKKQIVTVGDLCYVTLGQIVNRRFIVGGFVGAGKLGFVRSGSATRSATLRRRVIADWGDLTTEKHLASLVNDFLKPDTAQRRIDAAVRLAYYSPRHLEPLAIALLNRPTYSASAVDVFVEDTLYKTADGPRRRELLSAFVKRQGELARAGVERKLLVDRLSTEPLDSGEPNLPTELLLQLFNRSTKELLVDTPFFTDAFSDQDKAEFIQKALLFDTSKQIDKAILALMEKAGSKDELALACMHRLLGRGFDAQIERHCKKRIAVLLCGKQGERENGVDDRRFTPVNYAHEYEKILSKMGYTALHIAVERGITWRVEQLMASGASPALHNRQGDTAWHLAVLGGQPTILFSLAATSQGLECKNRKGMTPAVLALSQNDEIAVRILARAGCVVDSMVVASLVDRSDVVARLLKKRPVLIQQKVADDRTWLHLAAFWGNTNTVSTLLGFGLEIDARDRWGGTPLMLAAKNGNNETVRVLLSHKASVRAHNYGREAIHFATQGGHRSTIELLLAHGANINAGEGDGTPLHLAINKYDSKLAAFLLQNGAIPNAHDRDRTTPLHLAVTSGQTDLVRLLLTNRADATLPGSSFSLSPLHRAAIQGSDTIVDLLLRAGADRNQVTVKEGETALHLAAEAGNAAVVRLLLARKVAVNARSTPSRQTALHSAARQGHDSIVQMLLSRGANPHMADQHGRQPLHEACQHEHGLDAARTLVNGGASLTAKDDQGDTPLHLAVATGNRRLVAVLIARGANLKSVNLRGETPLHSVLQTRKAIFRSVIDGTVEEVEHNWLAPQASHMASYLLEFGANANASDHLGQTPLHWAAETGNLDVVRLLLSNGARPGECNRAGMTPLDVAISRKKTDVAALLRRIMSRR